jgi:hypothetical protein
MYVVIIGKKQLKMFYFSSLYVTKTHKKSSKKAASNPFFEQI